MPRDMEAVKKRARIATAMVFGDRDAALVQMAQRIVSLEEKIDDLLSAVFSLTTDQRGKR